MSRETRRTKQNRTQRHRRVRSRVVGTQQRPRLSLRLSNTGVIAQIINDAKGATLVAVKQPRDGTMTETAAKAGSEIAKKAKKAKIVAVSFDRGHKKYHGRVHSFAEAARKDGLEF